MYTVYTMKNRFFRGAIISKKVTMTPISWVPWIWIISPLPSCPFQLEVLEEEISDPSAHASESSVTKYRSTRPTPCMALGWWIDSKMEINKGYIHEFLWNWTLCWLFWWEDPSQKVEDVQKSWKWEIESLKIHGFLFYDSIASTPSKAWRVTHHTEKPRAL